MAECIRCKALLKDNETVCPVCQTPVGEALPQYAFEYKYDTDPFSGTIGFDGDKAPASPKRKLRFSYKYILVFAVIAVIIAAALMIYRFSRQGGASTPEKSASEYFKLIVDNKYNDKLFDLCVPPSVSKEVLSNSELSKADTIYSTLNAYYTGDPVSYVIVGCNDVPESTSESMIEFLRMTFDSSDLEITDVKLISAELTYADGSTELVYVTVFCSNNRWYVTP